MVYKWGYRKSLRPVQGHTLLKSADVSTTNPLVVGGEGVGPCWPVVSLDVCVCVCVCVCVRCSFVDETDNFPCTELVRIPESPTCAKPPTVQGWCVSWKVMSEDAKAKEISPTLLGRASSCAASHGSTLGLPATLQSHCWQFCPTSIKRHFIFTSCETGWWLNQLSNGL